MTDDLATESTSGRIPTVTGWCGDSGYFAFEEHETFDPVAVTRVLRGEIAGVMFRGMILADVRTAIAERFWASPHRRTRGAEAPGYYLGTYHYHKPTMQYLTESRATSVALDEVLGVADDPLKTFYGGLQRALGPSGVTVRLAEHDGLQACRGLLRSWHGEGGFALAPHEDEAQCSEPQQADFEIQKVAAKYQVAALNMCLENGEGGRLAYWNIRPDETSKRRLGVHYTGSPYPIESLDGIEMTWVEVHPGDVYVFNGSHVHAVEPCSDPALRRTTLAGIFGFADDHTVVSWT